MAYDEAARRLYGPDAYLNLPHLQANFNSPIISQKFKWMPSKNFISMFPSSGLLNINAQPSVHVIHQRLQEIKQNRVLSSSSNSKGEAHTIGSKTHAESMEEKDAETSSEKMLGDVQEKPQIDLNEFLQQLGILKEESHTEGADSNGSLALQEASSSRDYNNEFGDFADKSFNWDALIEMHGIADNQGSEASHFQLYDINEELAFPTSLWNF
ncbi:Dehydration-responsive element-binding protein 2F [Quillaja saponaria]|uniref:Dehydration-responsive element-binding protein 2F n=1 Tax=Quillaja saponaria TaxID=32244 RepID=A0AAD7Q8L6_QUISA|nr:Dehydration-responsive element-binding protein 2F [Quillaja saponaria]